MNPSSPKVSTATLHAARLILWATFRAHRPRLRTPSDILPPSHQLHGTANKNCPTFIASCKTQEKYTIGAKT